MLGDTVSRFNEIQPSFFGDATRTGGSLKEEIKLGVRILTFQIIQETGKGRTEGA